MSDDRARDGLIEGRFSLIERIEDWGVGECWRARDTTDRSRVAVKLLPLLGPADRKVESEFRSLAKRLERLQHRCVARTLAHGVWKGRPYLVTEFFEGTSLRRGLDAARVAKHLLAPDMLAGVLDRACEGVAAAHGAERPLVHGALEPASIVAALIDGRLEVRVLDFGLVSLFGARCSSGRSSEYVAPELEDDPDAVSPASDVFALGALVLECVTDRRTVSGGPAATIGGLSAVAKRRDDLPPALMGVASRATKLDPDQRFVEVTALREALAAAWAPPDRPTQAAEEAPPPNDVGETSITWVRFAGVAAPPAGVPASPHPRPMPPPAVSPTEAPDLAATLVSPASPRGDDVARTLVDAPGAQSMDATIDTAAEPPTVRVAPRAAPAKAADVPPPVRAAASRVALGVAAALGLLALAVACAWFVHAMRH